MKRALCVGVNDYPMPDMDLKGCVNDANDWAKLLVDHYDFAKDDLTMLLNGEATKANVMQALKNLVTGAEKGDVLVFQNSSHGTYVADHNHDEKLYDEAMCPWDTEDHLIVDDELRELFENLANGVNLYVVSDSCFSGTLTRALLGPVATPDDRRARFLSPDKIGRRVIDTVTARPRSGNKEKFPESKMKDLLLSGCNDRQYSYDAKIGGRYNGAMTHFALKVIKHHKYKITARQMNHELVQALDDAQYNQTPQLEGTDENKDRQLFT